jgi:vacuolar-type H+-ATPase subunit E/Vma4
MKLLGSVASVVAAVREEATAEVEKLEREVGAELRRLEQEAARRPPALADRNERLAAARREARERLAREDWEDSRTALEERERWIQQVVAEGRRRLAEPMSAERQRALLTRLAAEALERLPGDRFEVVACAADAALMDEEWCREVASAAGKLQLCAVAAEEIAGGCIVRTADRKIAFDNTFDARARRLESAWRAALGSSYETWTQESSRSAS